MPENTEPDPRLKNGDFPFLHPRTEPDWPIGSKPHTMTPIVEHLPATVAAGIVADLTSVHEKIPAELRTAIESPQEQARRIRRLMGGEPRPIVIGLGGYQEHGKDALADILVERHKFMKFGMSDAINEILLVLDPWVTEDERYASFVTRIGYTEAKKHPEVRRLLRIFGTEVGRDMIDPDIWVNMAGKKIRAALDNGAPGVAVTGIRNGGNEIGLVKIFGGTTVWVDRPGHPIPDTTHASENTLGPQDFDRLVKNDGDLIDLTMAADMLIDGIKTRRAEQGR